jgi:hypothetical protein
MNVMDGICFGVMVQKVQKINVTIYTSGMLIKLNLKYTVQGS